MREHHPLRHVVKEEKGLPFVAASVWVQYTCSCGGWKSDVDFHEVALKRGFAAHAAAEQRRERAETKHEGGSIGGRRPHPVWAVVLVLVGVLCFVIATGALRTAGDKHSYAFYVLPGGLCLIAAWVVLKRGIRS